jgi:hypothetical protein
MAYGQNMNAPMAGMTGLAALKGRQGDNTLVHVNPMELKALDNMAPGGLTRNPYTGLPEAFKLKDILPTLGAIAGTVFLGPTFGAMVGSGLGAAGGTALAGGNKEEILGAGLVSGATAGLLGGASPTAAATTAGQEAIKEGALKETAKQAGADSIVLAGSTGTPATSFIPDSIKNFAKAPIESAAKFLPKDGAIDASFKITDFAADEALRQTAQDAATKAGREAFVKQGLAGAAGAALATPVNMPGEPPVGPATGTDFERQQTASREDIDKFIRRGGPIPQFFNQGFVQAEEGGQIADAPMFSGMVEGRGDGMSDEVPFEVVGDPEIDTAMLSPDEYVMDAYTVAALGNGSSDAGAEKLDAFRKELREKVYGKKEQPKEIDGAKELSKLA